MRRAPIEYLRVLLGFTNMCNINTYMGPDTISTYGVLRIKWTLNMCVCIQHIYYNLQDLYSSKVKILQNKQRKENKRRKKLSELVWTHKIPYPHSGSFRLRPDGGVGDSMPRRDNPPSQRRARRAYLSYFWIAWWGSTLWSASGVGYCFAPV